MSETTSQPVREELEGKLLDGRFFVQKQLGAGNFGAVYLAEQRVFDARLRSVALKLFRGEAVTPENVAEKLNDFVILVQLQQESSYAHVSRYLVTVYDAGFLHDRPGQAFVTMEYVEGYETSHGGSIRTLQGMIRAFKPVPVDLALRWMIQILKPLAWMHSLPHPVLHCDLKPDNILVCGKDTLKVADFGLAQLAFGIMGASNAGGALICQAPETLAGQYPTPAADVYSLGLILYEMLAGENPLTRVGLEALAAERHEKFRQLQIQARHDGLPSLMDYEHPELEGHPLLLEIIKRCLQFKASERYDNAVLLLRAVQDYAAGQKTEVLPIFEEQKKPEEPTPVLSLDRLLAEVEVLLRRGRTEEARVRCEQARTRFPQSGKPYRWLAEIHLTQGQWKEALQVCAEGRKIDPNESELFEAIANAYDVGGQSNVAKQMRNTAMSLRQRTRK